MAYAVLLVLVLVISPFILLLASKQNKKSKAKLRFLLLAILSAQLFLGFFNWENFTSGRSGFNLALAYPNSLVGLFFIVSLIEVILLLISKSFNTLVVVLNFANAVVIFLGMIRLSDILGFQAVSLVSIAAVFLVLLGNVVALAYINKDKNLLKKYPFAK